MGQQPGSKFTARLRAGAVEMAEEPGSPDPCSPCLLSVNHGGFGVWKHPSALWSGEGGIWFVFSVIIF